jgi:hypothetical protein
MTIRSRYSLIGASVLTCAIASLVFAQTTRTTPAPVAPKPAPVTFDKGVRAADPRAPTPQFAAIATGLFARPIVDTKSVKGDYAIRVWSLSVAPKTSTAATTLPGAAMLSLTAGSVEYIAGEVRGKLAPGDTAAIPEGSALRFINNDAQKPAVLRAVIVSGQ